MSAAAGLALIVAATAALLFLLAAASAAVLLLLVLISALVVHRKLLSIPLAAGTEVTNWKNELSVPQRTIAHNRAQPRRTRAGAKGGYRRSPLGSNPAAKEHERRGSWHLRSWQRRRCSTCAIRAPDRPITSCRFQTLARLRPRLRGCATTSRLGRRCRWRRGSE